jgi:isopenicillin-N epimerase
MLDRRNFLSATATGLAASLTVPGGLLAQLEKTPPLPDRSLLDTNEDKFWAEMRRQFLIPEDEIYLNNGTVGSSPAPVLRAVFDGYNYDRKDGPAGPRGLSHLGIRPPGTSFATRSRRSSAARAMRLPCCATPPRPTATSPTAVDMQPGDEVLMTDQEHPGGEHPWDLKAKRYGIVIKKITLPRPVKDAAQVLQPGQRRHHAAHPRALLQPHHHILGSGAAGEAVVRAGPHQGHSLRGRRRARYRHDEAERPRNRRRHVLLQPAQMAAFAPKGSGFLYVRDEVIDRLWNTIATEGWDETKIRAERFQRIGSSNVPSLWGLRASIKLANDIGMEHIERRHRQLADHMLGEMMKRGAESWTSPDAALRCAIVTVNVPPIVRMELETWLWKTHKIRIRGAEPHKLRLSTPYYLQKEDIARFLEKFDEYKKEQKMA